MAKSKGENNEGGIYREREKGKENIDQELQWPKRKRDERKERDNSLALPHIQSSTSFFSNGSQARLFTASCGSFKPRPVAVPWRRISRLSRMSRLRWRVPLFLSEKVAIILGSSHLMLPLHSLACFDMPEMLLFARDVALCHWTMTRLYLSKILAFCHITCMCIS